MDTLGKDEECPTAVVGVDLVSDTEFVPRKEDLAAGELNYVLGAVEAAPKEDDEILSKDM